MRISGTEPSSVILSKKGYVQKLKGDVPNVPQLAEAKRNGVLNPQITIPNDFNTENLDALKRYELTEISLCRRLRMLSLCLFLRRLQSIATHKDNVFRCLSVCVCLTGSHTSLFFAGDTCLTWNVTILVAVLAIYAKGWTQGGTKVGRSGLLL